MAIAMIDQGAMEDRPGRDGRSVIAGARTGHDYEATRDAARVASPTPGWIPRHPRPSVPSRSSRNREGGERRSGARGELRPTRDRLSCDPLDTVVFDDLTPFVRDAEIDRVGNRGAVDDEVRVRVRASGHGRPRAGSGSAKLDALDTVSRVEDDHRQIVFLRRAREAVRDVARHGARDVLHRETGAVRDGARVQAALHGLIPT